MKYCISQIWRLVISTILEYVCIYSHKQHQSDTQNNPNANVHGLMDSYCILVSTASFVTTCTAHN
jgi:hypothetical protein